MSEPKSECHDFPWWRDGVIYQIYTRSFLDSNNDGLGDLRGIISRLDYLSDLGISAIWLSPIHPSPDVDFGYDVSDYYAIDPRFGSMADFEELLGKAHQKGLRIILDMVLNHTSDQNPWFQQSRKSRDNIFSDWYLWRDPSIQGKAPNNWQSMVGGSGWEFEPRRGQYYFHMFYKQQPDLNWRNPIVKQTMMDILRFWLEKGVDGFRFDIFNVFFKDKNFCGNPLKIGLRGFDRQEHIHDIDQPEMLPQVEEIRQLMDGYESRYSVGEPFLPTPEKAARYSAPGRFNAAFNFDIINCPWKPDQFLQRIEDWENLLGRDVWPSYVFNNHDNKRSSSRLTRGEDDRILKAAAALLLTQKGTPYMYYGEEIGMRDVSVKRSEIQDPVGRRYWPFYRGRDGCRSPMQWNDQKFAGFSEFQPWMKIHADFRERNVAGQKANPYSLFSFYRTLIRLRTDKEALRCGMFMPLTFNPRRVLAYLRQTEDQTIMVVINFSRRPVKFFLGSSLARQNWQLLLSSKRNVLDNLDRNVLQLGSYEAEILEQIPGRN
ncbi:MAG: alpha-glucosidase [Anaerolineaceae bacterium]